MNESQSQVPDQRGRSEPTPWELHRSDQKILETLDRIETRMLTLAVFQEYQRGADHRAAVLEETQGQDRAAAAAATTAALVKLEALENRLSLKIEISETKTNTKIERQAERAELLETTARELKSRNWVSIGMSVLGTLLAIGAALVLKGLGA